MEEAPIFCSRVAEQVPVSIRKQQFKLLLDAYERPELAGMFVGPSLSWCLPWIVGWGPYCTLFQEHQERYQEASGTHTSLVDRYWTGLGGTLQ